MYTETVRVRFYETDLMEVAHHSNHIRWFEAGRVGFFRHIGVDLRDMMADDIVFPIKAVSCTYIEPAAFEDELCIETRLKKMTRAQMVFSYRIVRVSDGALIAEGESQNVFTKRSTGKLVRLSDRYYIPLLKAAEAEL